MTADEAATAIAEILTGTWGGRLELLRRRSERLIRELSEAPTVQPSVDRMQCPCGEKFEPYRLGRGMAKACRRCHGAKVHRNRRTGRRRR